MRKIIVSTYVTLDGVMQPIDWSAQSQDPASTEERGTYARDLLFEADTLLLGRETYQIFAEVWPTRTAADDGPGEAGSTDRINSLPEYVASSTLSEPLSWNATLIKGDVPREIAKLKEQPGQNIVVYGCGQLAKTLFEHNLVDEFRFWVYPVVRGKGARLFEDGVAADLELVETRVFGGGFVVLTCTPKRVV
ncbi:MAG: dihydrofolate reductase family protein [Chloroflexota bacterium]|nr:dihydrofolate reductase family protein [Chloroflexota bacterium]